MRRSAEAAWGQERWVAGPLSAAAKWRTLWYNLDPFDGDWMPTLIRLVISLLFLAGLGFAGLYALTVFVQPGEKLITVRVPQRAMALTPVAPKPQPQVTEAAVLPSPDDPTAKTLDTPNE